MLKIDSYSSKGAKLAQISLPKEWEEKGNNQLLSQAVRVYMATGHTGLRSTKTRAEVNRTTKKLYKQKGTGGARHGSRKAPIFVGGGVALGPRPEKRILSLPLKMKRKALKVAITALVKEKKVISADLDFKKTSEANKFITKVFGKKLPKITFVLKKENQMLEKYLRNIKDTKVILFPNLNAFDVFMASSMIFDKSIFKTAAKTVKGEVKKWN